VRPIQATRVRRESVFAWWDYPLFIGLALFNVGALAYFLRAWITTGPGTVSFAVFVAFTVLMLFPIATFELRWLTLPLMRRPLPMPAPPHMRVGVATTFVPGAESLLMLEETVRAMVRMAYSHETWVLDEGDDPAVRALCTRLGAHHFSRKGMVRYQAASGPFQARTKYGNYNAWFEEIGYARYDYIVAFDPDHVPLPGFLTEVLGYFADPTIGYVQAAQVYYNQPASFIARGAAEETYAYYSSIQMTSYALGYPIVTGCHNAHRVTALHEVGGFAPHEADDMLTTVAYRVQGWRGVYLPRILAHGLTPVDWPGYLGQQRRWARSVLDVKFRIYPKIASRLPIFERAISFVHGLYYLEGFATALQLLLLGGMLVTGVIPSAVALFLTPSFFAVVVALQLCDWYRQRFFLDLRTEAGIHWRQAILRAAKWPWILAALGDAMTRRWGIYTITPKAKTAVSGNPLVRPHLAVAGFIALCWVSGRLLGVSAHPLLSAAAVLVIGQALLVVATGYLSMPEPYDPELARRELGPAPAPRGRRANHPEERPALN
jgi:cellulose synthase (UDP-forming)